MEVQPYGWIYAIVNTVSGKLYVGQTTKNPPELRWTEHKSPSSRARSSMPISRDIAKHGATNFIFIPLLPCRDQSALDQAERILIAAWSKSPLGYNIHTGGDGIGKQSPEMVERRVAPLRGVKRSSAARIAISLASRGKSCAWATPPVRRRDDKPPRTNTGVVENGRPRLTREDIRAIFVDVRPQADIASEYRITQSMVSCIKRRQSWAKETRDLTVGRVNAAPSTEEARNEITKLSDDGFSIRHIAEKLGMKRGQVEAAIRASKKEASSP